MRSKLILTTLCGTTLCGSLLLSAEAGAVPVYTDESKGVAVNVGVLLQPWFQVTAPAAANEGTPAPNLIGAPDGKSPSFDFFLRRARLMLYGSVSKELSFFIETDQANFGKYGRYDSAMIVQDAFLSYAFVPEFKIDAGMMLVPLSHHTIEGATGLHTLDYHGEMIRFPVGSAFRDFGVQFRGLLADNLIHYRVGVFEGVRDTAKSAPPAGAPPRPTFNDTGLPRVAGQLRLNLLGVEPDFFLKGIYFSATPIVTIGAGVDYQSKAVQKLDGSVGAYLAASGDLFAELPMTADDEFVGKANFFYYGEGASFAPGSSALPAGGIALYAEAGFRHDWIEPLAFVEYLKGKNDSLKILAPHAGANFWINKHTFNVKADVGYRKTDTPATTFKDIIGTVQAQVFF